MINFMLCEHLCEVFLGFWMMSRFGSLYVDSSRFVKITMIRENGHGDCLVQTCPTFLHVSFKWLFTPYQVHHEPWYSSYSYLSTTSHALVKSTTSLERRCGIKFWSSFCAFPLYVKCSQATVQPFDVLISVSSYVNSINVRSNNYITYMYFIHLAFTCLSNLQLPSISSLFSSKLSCCWSNF